MGHFVLAGLISLILGVLAVFIVASQTNRIRVWVRVWVTTFSLTFLSVLYVSFLFNSGSTPEQIEDRQNRLAEQAQVAKVIVSKAQRGDFLRWEDGSTRAIWVISSVDTGEGRLRLASCRTSNLPLIGPTPLYYPPYPYSSTKSVGEVTLISRSTDESPTPEWEDTLHEYFKQWLGQH